MKPITSFADNPRFSMVSLQKQNKTKPKKQQQQFQQKAAVLKHLVNNSVRDYKMKQTLPLPD